MHYNKVLLAALALSTSFAEVALAASGGNSDQGGQGGAQDQQGQQAQDQQQNAQASSASSAAQSQGGTPATLDASALQTASNQNGQGNGVAGVKTGQAKANTDPANFINVCAGGKKTLTNGAQVKAGSCNGIPMGDIPSTDNMVSTILTSPTPGQNLAANQDFVVKMQVANINAGVFTNPTVTYYSAPQALDPNNKNIIGHVHVTIQTLGSNMTPQQAPDPKLFVFFKGIDDAGDGKGGLATNVAGGLPAGNYRVCTMSSSATHQAVLMPVAQRGAQDDCTKFQVGGSDNAASGAPTGTAKPAATATPTANNAIGGAQNGTQSGAQQAAVRGRKGGKGQRKQARRPRFQSRPYVA